MKNALTLQLPPLPDFAGLAETMLVSGLTITVALLVLRTMFEANRKR